MRFCKLPGVLFAALLVVGQAAFAFTPDSTSMLLDYYFQLSRPKPIQIESGAALEAHHAKLRQKLLESIGLNPLPERIPLDVHESKKIDHPWCVISRIYYQIWPGIYASGLLYFPKNKGLTPGPALLCPHGHWTTGNADPDVQRSCLNFARLGYVVFSPDVKHYEDMAVGVSNQTMMVWTNMRAIDYLETLPIDKERIGAAGASGGGLQTEMLVALDKRIKAVAIIGYTCNMLHLLYPPTRHCGCNHFPDLLKITDHPEISTLALPRPVLYITMNDWTRTFQEDNFPQIKKLYEANGVGDRVKTKYYSSEHNFDFDKRVETYRWMHRWLCGQTDQSMLEPATEIVPEHRLIGLSAHLEHAKPYTELKTILSTPKHYCLPEISTSEQFAAYRKSLSEDLGKLLGTDIPVRPGSRPIMCFESRDAEGVCTEHWFFPTEGPISCPVSILHSDNTTPPSRRPVLIILSDSGVSTLTTLRGTDSPVSLAKKGWIVVLPSIRIPGQLLPELETWDRKGMTWGRPVYGMAATDLRGIVDGIESRTDTDMNKLKLVVRNSGDLSMAAMFAATFDQRLKDLDLDFAGTCYETRQLPVFARILHYGDVLQFASLLIDRNLVLRNVPKEAGEPTWLSRLFALENREQALHFLTNADKDLPLSSL